MALNLHPECRKRLVEVLTEGLPKVVTKNGMFLDVRSRVEGLFKAEIAIPKAGRVREQLVEYVDEFPAMEFIGEVLATELMERDQYLADVPSISLTELDGYQNPRVVAQVLVDKLESLPWQYALTVRLPDDVSRVLSKFIEEFPLSTQVRLIRPTPEIVRRFPLKAKDQGRHQRIYGRGGLLIPPRDPKWDEAAVYLQIDVEGFVSRYGSSVPAVNAKALVRAFCGLGLAVRLFRTQTKFTELQFEMNKADVCVHKREGDSWDIDGKFGLEERHSATFNSLMFYDFDGKLISDKEKVGWAEHALKMLRTVFSSGEKGGNIIRAAQWLFDSYSGDDELLRFVQSMVVLEILLGDKSVSGEMGLGQLLRNRCAYLIGKSHRQRVEVLRDFNEIYRVRSQIVHSGKNKLTFEESSLFDKLRWMGRRVICEEIELLAADMKNSKE